MKTFFSAFTLTFIALFSFTSHAKGKRPVQPTSVWVCETRPLIQESGDPVVECSWVKR